MKLTDDIISVLIFPKYSFWSMNYIQIFYGQVIEIIYSFIFSLAQFLHIYQISSHENKALSPFHHKKYFR